ncbi:LOW QUALITY PROTEIN: hypothetical protein HID58_095442, partial [Brassica napus]
NPTQNFAIGKTTPRTCWSRAPTCHTFSLRALTCETPPSPMYSYYSHQRTRSHAALAKCPHTHHPRATPRVSSPSALSINSAPLKRSSKPTQTRFNSKPRKQKSVLKMFIESFKVESPNVKYTENEIHSVYDYETTEVVHENVNGAYQWIVKPRLSNTISKPTLVSQIRGYACGLGRKQWINLSRRGISWGPRTRCNKRNYFGSLTQASSIRVGSFNGEEIYAPFKRVNPDDVVFGGVGHKRYEFSDAMGRAKLRPYMESIVHSPGIYDPDFIAANQGSRANNVIKGTKKEQVDQIIKDMREFKEKNKVDKVVVLALQQCDRGLNDTMENLMNLWIGMSPRSLLPRFMLLHVYSFHNGSPQNTFVPGLIDLAIKNNVLIGGDDFKSGQTKMKSVLVDSLLPTSIVSYNHLGNNDGMNLSAPQTFRSKEISKSNVVDDMVASNGILFEPGEHPDMPWVSIHRENIPWERKKHNLDAQYLRRLSLLAAPIILDLHPVPPEHSSAPGFSSKFKTEKRGFVLFSKYIGIFRKLGEKFHFPSCGTQLRDLNKAPLVPPGTRWWVNAAVEAAGAKRATEIILCSIGRK